MYYTTKYVIPENKIVLVELIVVQLIRKYPPLYGTPRLVTVFTRACPWTLP
jgi:hypothetical protein